MIVDVYFNLHKRTFSVRACEGPNKGRVIAHLDTVYLTCPSFVVSAAGRERVRRERKKYVHAVVRGSLSDFCRFWQATSAVEFSEVSYNPYVNDTFVTQSGDAVTAAGNALLRVAENGRPLVFATI